MNTPVQNTDKHNKTHRQKLAQQECLNISVYRIGTVFCTASGIFNRDLIVNKPPG